MHTIQKNNSGNKMKTHQFQMKLKSFSSVNINVLEISHIDS